MKKSEKQLVARPQNPFVEGTDIPDEFFCDRTAETGTIVRLLEGGSNIVLKSPRRMGKSSLVNHVFHQDGIALKYNTLYLDLLGTGSAEDFIREFQRVFTSDPSMRSGTVKEILKSLPEKAMIEAEFNSLAGTGKIKLGLTDLKEIKLNLDTIFGYLENTAKPNVVVFDEFQQIKYYPEPMAAILRAYIQRLNNTRFIFSGSSRRMLSTMFNASNEPFYHSAESLDLERISCEAYTEFCIDNFDKFGKAVDPDAVVFAYELAGGVTYDMQRLMKYLFADTPAGVRASKEDVKTAVEKILDSLDQTYRERLTALGNAKEKKVLIAVGLEGLASGMLSQKIIKDYNLGPVSSVSQALDNLCNEEKLNMMLRVGNSYKLQDKMLELWIARQYGVLDLKYATAGLQLRREMEAERSLKLPDFPKLRK